jgi:hypothetical protein
MRDFSIQVYHSLLKGLDDAGYQFQTLKDYVTEPAPKAVILRHDVDDRKLHSLEFARIQKSKGILGTYYFRIVPESFDKKVIKEIADMGHEIGYHYEDMDFARGNEDRAIKLFQKHLKKLREITPVSSICMHGSPRSKFDNRDVWRKYDYKEFGIIAEPYFDLDYKSIYYLTDTGRRWDGHKVSIRDKVENHFNISFHSTFDIIKALENNSLPDKVMFTFHPQRWTDSSTLWIKEKWIQSLKNQVKFWLIKLKKHPTSYKHNL